MDKVDMTHADLEYEAPLIHSKGTIIATLGRACKDPETMIQMIDSGMNVVRMRL